MNTYTILNPMYSTDDGCYFSSNTQYFEQTIDNNTEVEGEKLDYNTNYYYCSYLYDGDNYCFGNVESFKTKEKVMGENLCPDGNHPHMIDLGLPSGTKWCCCNVDANAPEEYGGYYAWGETKDGNKNEYSIKTYEHKIEAEPWDYWDGSDPWFSDNSVWFIYDEEIEGIDYSINCAMTDIGAEISGTSNDVAYTTSGGSRRMPTMSDLEELGNNCKSKSITYKGIKGTVYTGSNGNMIFLPAAGFRHEEGYGYNLWGLSDTWGNPGDALYYWLGTHNGILKSHAYSLYYDKLSQRDSHSRYDGLSVRGVSK